MLGRRRGRICGRAVTTALVLALGLALTRSARGQNGISQKYGTKRGVVLNFICDDGVTRLRQAWVNDDYCDCPDGSDEKLTSACSHLKGLSFRCENKGHKPMEIPRSRVGDGICDCCDGTDERDLPGTCTDQCAQIGLSARRETAQKQRRLRQGLRQQRANAEQFQQLRDADVLAIKRYEEQTDHIRSFRSRMGDRLYHEEAIERQEQIWRAANVLERQTGDGDGDEAGTGASQDVSSTSTAAGRDAAGSGGSTEAGDGVVHTTSVKFLGPSNDEEARNANLSVAVPAMKLRIAKSKLFHGHEKEDAHTGHASMASQVCTLEEFLSSKPSERASTLEIIKAKTRWVGTFGLSLSDIAAGLGGAPPDMEYVRERKAQLRTADQKRRNGFMGPIFNGGRAGWMRGGRYVISGVGLALSPLRLVWEVSSLLLSGGGFVLSSITPNVISAPITSRYERLKKYLWRRVGVRMRRVWYRNNGPWAWRAYWNAAPELYRYFFPNLDKSHVRPQAEVLRKAIAVVDRQLKDLERRIESLKKKLAEDYGPSDRFRGLAGRCLSTRIQGYNYEVCPFQKATQDGSVSLGKWHGWGDFRKDDKEPADGSVPVDGTENLSAYMSWWFTEGTACYQGPKRRAVVHLECGILEKLRTVVEPEICLYEMTLETPAACDATLLDPAYDQVEDACWNDDTASCV